jgi:hypothetical protein
MKQKTPARSLQGAETFVEMLEVYGVCVKIGRSCEELLNYLIDMELVALNAEIASAHARQNQEAFSVLSSEAGVVAKRMSAAIAQITARADELSKNSLNGIVQARLSHKLLEVPNRDKAEVLPASRKAIESGILRSEELVKRTAIFIDEVFSDINAVLTQILRENKRFETIATYFSIEASRDPESQAYFANIAQMLRGICTQTRTCIQTMGALADDTSLTALIHRESFSWDAA